MTHELNQTDLAVVREALAEIQARPLPQDRSTVGCVVALPGFLLLLVFPMVGRMLDVGSGAATVVLGIGIAFLVVGLIFWFTAGGAIRRHTSAAVEAALRQLSGDDDDRETTLRAAVLLVMNAYTPQGPSHTATVNFGDAERRLGDRLELVKAVERVILDEEAAYPAFTLDEGSEEASSEG